MSKGEPRQAQTTATDFARLAALYLVWPVEVVLVRRSQGFKAGEKRAALVIPLFTAVVGAGTALTLLTSAPTRFPIAFGVLLALLLVSMVLPTAMILYLAIAVATRLRG